MPSFQIESTCEICNKTFRKTINGTNLAAAQAIFRQQMAKKHGKGKCDKK